MSIEELEESALRVGEQVESVAEEIDTAPQIEVVFEGGSLGNESLGDGVQVFRRAPVTPVLLDRIVDDLHEQGARMRYPVDAAKRLDGAQRDLLLQILIVDGRAGSLRCDVNHGTNIGRIYFHVTVLPNSRLYKT